MECHGEDVLPLSVAARNCLPVRVLKPQAGCRRHVLKANRASKLHDQRAANPTKLQISIAALTVHVAAQGLALARLRDAEVAVANIEAAAMEARRSADCHARPAHALTYKCHTGSLVLLLNKFFGLARWGIFILGNGPRLRLSTTVAGNQP